MGVWWVWACGATDTVGLANAMSGLRCHRLTRTRAPRCGVATSLRTRRRDIVLVCGIVVTGVGCEPGVAECVCVWCKSTRSQLGSLQLSPTCPMHGSPTLYSCGHRWRAPLSAPARSDFFLQRVACLMDRATSHGWLGDVSASLSETPADESRNDS